MSARGARSRPGSKRAGRAARTTPVGPARLQKLLAAAGFGSRRAVEELIRDGRVSVNGQVAHLGMRADPAADRVALDGEALHFDAPLYWVVHKPSGVLTTLRDPEGRRTIRDLLPRDLDRIFPVGRLDVETEGLVLLTNDGDLAHVLLHPSHGCEREYRVVVKGELGERAVRALERGVWLEDGRTAPARVRSVRVDPDAGITRFGLVLREGRKRQIRRSLIALGHPVKTLVRVRMGPLRLGRMPRGQARPLGLEEVEGLREHVAQLAAGRTLRPARRRRAPRGR